jgi:hypothetical protein
LQTILLLQQFWRKKKAKEITKPNFGVICWLEFYRPFSDKKVFVWEEKHFQFLKDSKWEVPVRKRMIEEV